MTHFKDLSQAHTIVYLKKYNSKIPTFTPSLLNQNIESLSTICRLQENKMSQKTATTGRQPVEFSLAFELSLALEFDLVFKFALALEFDLAFEFALAFEFG